MHLQTAAAIACLGALCNCASTPQLPSIRDGTAVSIEVSTSPPSSDATAIENKALRHDTSAGAPVLVRLRAAYGDSSAGPVTKKIYEYATPVSSLAIWLDERNDFVDTSIRVAMQQLATQIVSELTRS